jgi:hypothetical protein
MLLVSIFLSTKWGEGKRIFTIIFCYIPGIISCVILRTVPLRPSTRGAHLAAVFIVPMVAASAAVIYSLLASNIAGYTKKTVSGAMLFSANSVANIVSPQTFLHSQIPYYQTGIAVTLAAFCINIILFCVLYLVYSRSNAQRGRDPAGAESDDATQDLVDAFSDLTDRENKKVALQIVRCALALQAIVSEEALHDHQNFEHILNQYNAIYCSSSTIGFVSAI